jgi:hypothetical protein
LFTRSQLEPGFGRYRFGVVPRFRRPNTIAVTLWKEVLQATLRPGESA